MALCIIFLTSLSFGFTQNNDNFIVSNNKPISVFDFFTSTLDYNKLSSDTCKKYHAIVFSIEFKVNKQNSVYDINVQLDSMDFISEIFKNALEKSNGLWSKPFLKKYSGTLIIQPIYFELQGCTATKNLKHSLLHDTSCMNCPCDMYKQAMHLLARDVVNVKNGLTKMFHRFNALPPANILSLPLCTIDLDPKRRIMIM